MRVIVLVKATEDSEKGEFPKDWTTQMFPSGRLATAVAVR